MMKVLLLIGLFFGAVWTGDLPLVRIASIRVKGINLPDSSSEDGSTTRPVETIDVGVRFEEGTAPGAPGPEHQFQLDLTGLFFGTF